MNTKPVVAQMYIAVCPRGRTIDSIFDGDWWTAPEKQEFLEGWREMGLDIIHLQPREGERVVLDWCFECEYTCCKG